jgi:hypothetical protein
MSVYLDGELNPEKTESVNQHLKGCPTCSRGLAAIKNTWAMLGELEEIQPQQGYVGRFWTKLSLEKTWGERFWAGLEMEIHQRKWVPAMATICIVAIIGLLSANNYIQLQRTDQLLADLSEEDLEMVENMDLAENFNLIMELDFFEDFNIITNLDSLET